MNLIYANSPNCHRGRLLRQGADLAVIHYTAGMNVLRSVEGMCNSASQRSVHFAIGRTEEAGLYQLVALEDAAWHAGRSTCPRTGRKRCNNFSIGFEIANAGWFDQQDGEGRLYRSKSGRRVYYPYELNDLPPLHADGLFWEPFTDFQYEALAWLFEEIVLPIYPAIRLDRDHIVGHSEVSPGRKVDPGPAFDWERFMRRLWRMG